MSARGKAKAARVATAAIATLAIAVLVAVILTVVYLVRGCNDLFGSPRGGTIAIVPEVTGLPVAEAETKLRERGLIPDVVRRHYDDKHEAGQVTKQNPSADSRRREGTKVSLWESLGPASFTVPKLTGQHIDAVPQLIAQSGLRLGSVKKVFERDIPRGRVINQSPEPGREFHTPVPIDLVVADSTGGEEVMMPGVVGLRLDQAEEQLARANLHLARVIYLATDDRPQGTVLSQSVPQDKAVAIGARIELEVALPVELMQRKTKTITIRLPVLPGPENRQVKIKVFDDLSPAGYVEYDERHNPGDEIEHLVHVEGPATILIFIDDMEHPFREERL